MRLAIGIPIHREPKAQFITSLLALQTYIVSNGIKGRKLEKLTVGIGRKATLISSSRQDLLNESIKNDMTHLLYIDDDASFPPNILDSLCISIAPIIGVNFVYKDPNERKHVAVGFDNKRVESSGKTGIEEVKSIGFGMILLDLNTIKHIKSPHFEVLWDDKTQDYVGEDCYFCSKMRDNAIKIYVDHDASQNVGHIGDYIYTLNSYSK